VGEVVRYGDVEHRTPDLRHPEDGQLRVVRLETLVWGWQLAPCRVVAGRGDCLLYLSEGGFEPKKKGRIW
jgi:hypothetical protein